MLDELHSPFVAQLVEKGRDVRIEYPVHLLSLNAHTQRIKRLMRTSPGTEPLREAFEIDLVDLIEDRNHSLLNDLVFDSCDSDWALPSI